MRGAAREGARNALERLAAFGNVAGVRRALALGADVSEPNNFGYYPMHFAAFSRTAQMAYLLRAAGADVNARDGNGDTPLHHAARGGCAEVAVALARMGADLGTMNHRGEKPLDRASARFRAMCEKAAARRNARCRPAHTKEM